MLKNTHKLFQVSASLFILTALLGSFFSNTTSAAEKKWNVICILVDDMGWTDLGCYGSDLYQTPHIDQLAKDGMSFRQAYSACTVCSPTRAALMTGKYPARLRVTDWIPGMMPDNPKLLVPEWTKYLDHDETTIAEVFKNAGYTTASIGKWHLGGEEHYPETQGFDLNIAGTDRPSPPSYFSPWNIPTLPDGEPGEFLTDRLGQEVDKYLRSVQDKPFFLYFPHFAVHKPIQGREDLVEKYREIKRGKLTHKNAVYAALVEGVDETVGLLRATLQELGLADNTIIVFTSDNGGHIPTTSNVPLRAGKASAYEGGVRVPLIVYWPGVTQPGSESQVPVMTIDLFPSLLEMAGLKDDSGHQPDGLSVVEVLKGKEHLERDTLYWHYPHHQHYQMHGAMPYSAIRQGDYRLVEFFDDGRIELYNLKDDIGEENDLSKQQPEIAKALLKDLHDWRAEVKAQMPTPNPNYDPTKAQFNPKPKNRPNPNNEN